MSLADAPIGAECLVRQTAWNVRRTAWNPSFAKYHSAGISPGSSIRVLARYPSVQPMFAEVEVGGSRLITLPLNLAEDVHVRFFGEPTEQPCACDTPCRGCSGGCSCAIPKGG